MIFANPIMFFLMIGLPIFACLFSLAWKYFRKFEKSSNLNSFIHGSKIPSWYARLSVAFLKLLAFALIITGLAEPYINRPIVEPKYKNVRIFFLLDVSGSMIYAEDVKPNRLAAVRNEMLQFYNTLDGNYEVSLIPFAGSANPYYCPLTYSKLVFVPLMEKVGPDSAPTLGTDIPAAFDALKEQIKQNKLNETGINVVVLLTDGGKEEADAVDRIKLGKVVSELANQNSRIYVIGVGGKEAATLIRRDRQGRFIEYVKENGQTATSQLDEDILKQMAIQGKGDYLHFEQNASLHGFLSKVLLENRVPDNGNLSTEKVNLACYFFAVAVIILFVTFLFNRRLKC